MGICPTCGKPATETIGAAASVSETFDCRPDKGWLIDAQDKEIAALKDGYEELDSILCCRPGESIIEAAKRWRKTVKYAVEELLRIQRMWSDAGWAHIAYQRTRELLGEEKE